MVLNVPRCHDIFKVEMEKDAGKDIYILVIGDIEEMVSVREVVESVRREFGFPTQLVHSHINPEDAYDPRREQYHSTKILKEMLDDLPSDAIKMMAITSVDLFIPILTFVFGEAQLGGQVGIVSLARLRQEFYGLPPNQTLLQRRLIKELKHELGHTFGLVHCSRRECVMSVANNIADVDSKGMAFCEACRDLMRRS